MFIYAWLKIKLFVFVFRKQNNGAILERGRNAVLCYGKCWPNFLSEAIFNKTNFWFIFFSFLWHKIIVLISYMFIYAKIGNSKFVEMHGVASDIYPSALVFYTRHRVNIIQLLHFIECDMICYGALKSNIDQGQDFSLLLLRPLSTL